MIAVRPENVIARPAVASVFATASLATGGARELVLEPVDNEKGVVDGHIALQGGAEGIVEGHLPCRSHGQPVGLDFRAQRRVVGGRLAASRSSAHP
jgi:hypothetical protein